MSALSMLDLEELEAFGSDPGGFAFADWGGHIWGFPARVPSLTGLRA